MVRPPRKKHVPFRKIREQLQEILDYLGLVRPIEGGPLEQTRQGFRVKSQTFQDTIYTPRFKPTISDGNELSVGIGWVRAPREATDPTTAGLDHQIPTYHQAHFKPQINDGGLDDIDADPSPKLTATTGAPEKVQGVWLKVTFDKRATVIGAATADDGGTKTGAEVFVENVAAYSFTDTDTVTGSPAALDHDHGGATVDDTADLEHTHTMDLAGNDHGHPAVVILHQLNYSIKDDTAAGLPEIILSDAVYPDDHPNTSDSDTVYYIPMGTITTDSTPTTVITDWWHVGDITVAPETYFNSNDDDGPTGTNPKTG